MSAPINIPKKSDEYHRQRLETKVKMWEGKIVVKNEKKETKTMSISIKTFKENKII